MPSVVLIKETVLAGASSTAPDTSALTDIVVGVTGRNFEIQYKLGSTDEYPVPVQEPELAVSRTIGKASSIWVKNNHPTDSIEVEMWA